MSSVPRLTHRFDLIPIKIPARFLMRYTKLMPKFIWKDKGARIDKTIWKKNKIGGPTLPNFKLYHQTTGVKTGWLWWTLRVIGQWNRTWKFRNFLVHTNINWLLNFWQRLNGEKIAFSVNGALKNWISICKTNKETKNSQTPWPTSHPR